MDTFKYLGVLIHRRLTWSSHTNLVTAKATKVLNLLRRNYRNCNTKARNRAYQALVRPHMEYCAPVWAPNQKKDITKLEKVQSRAARWVCARWNRQSFSWDKSYQQCCIELNWLTLETRRDFHTCCQVYRSLNNLDCIPFSTYFSFNTHNTRSHPLSLQCSHSRINS